MTVKEARFKSITLALSERHGGIISERVRSPTGEAVPLKGSPVSVRIRPGPRVSCPDPRQAASVLPAAQCPRIPNGAGSPPKRSAQSVESGRGHLSSPDLVPGRHAARAVSRPRAVMTCSWRVRARPGHDARHGTRVPPASGHSRLTRYPAALAFEISLNAVCTVVARALARSFARSFAIPVACLARKFRHRSGARCLGGVLRGTRLISRLCPGRPG
jgi:hypothetical protein